jgi:hypothetical protein
MVIHWIYCHVCHLHRANKHCEGTRMVPKIAIKMDGRQCVVARVLASGVKQWDATIYLSYSSSVSSISRVNNRFSTSKVFLRFRFVATAGGSTSTVSLITSCAFTQDGITI